jgi:hypothetical protein
MLKKEDIKKKLDVYNKRTLTITLVINCGKTSYKKLCSGSPAASLHRKR